MGRRSALPGLILAGLLGVVGAGPAHAQGPVPTTFGDVIGSALLCRDDIENVYFHSWLTRFFGPAYKHEGGAFWFRTTDATLWGKPVEEVMVSDDTSPTVFVAAVVDAPPDELEQAVRTASGMRHLAADASNYPLRISSRGSKIAYYNTKSKIYCAKFKSLPQRP
jgi:hypothetical protein